MISKDTELRIESKQEEEEMGDNVFSASLSLRKIQFHPARK